MFVTGFFLPNKNHHELSGFAKISEGAGIELMQLFKLICVHFHYLQRKPKDDSVCLLPNLQCGIGPQLFLKEHPGLFKYIVWINSASLGCYRKLKEVAIHFVNSTFFNARQRRMARRITPPHQPLML